MKKGVRLISESNFEADAAILAENLYESYARQELAFEQSRFHVRELAEEIASVCEDPKKVRDTLAFLSAELSAKGAAFPSDPMAFQKKTQWFLLRMELYRKLGEHMLKHVPSFFWERNEISKEPVPQPARGKIVYQQNHYSDRAFLAFSSCEFIHNPRAVYRNSFSDICEDVYNGFAEYGILPIGNSDEGKLMRFVRLLEKYDLKIAASIAIEIPTNHDSVNELILIRRSQEIPFVLHKFPSYFEFSVVPDSPDTLLQMNLAAEFCGLKILRMDTLPVREGSSLAFYPVLEANRIPGETSGADLTTFYTYLSLDLPQAVPLGIYQKLQEKSLL